MFATMLLALTLDYRASQPLPPLSGSLGWGVNIHFTDEAPGEVAKIAVAGLHWVRMDFGWESIEKTKGTYDFTAYDRLLASLDKNHIRPMLIFDYGNHLYGDTAPRTQEARTAFCEFVKASVLHFRHRGVVWEMWNEPNIFFWKPKPNVTEYIALALDVGKAIRATAPDEWYVGPATSGFDWTFLSACCDAGLLAYWDAVSVHPYRQENPETALADWDRLRSMIAAAKPPQAKVGMLSGEWGYSNVWGGITPERQAEYVVREYLTNLIAGVPISIYYDWKDDGTDPKDGESHFGTVYPDLSVKPAYLAIKTLSWALDGFAYKGRVKLGAANQFALLFEHRSQQKVVVWTTAPSQDPSPVNNAQAFDLTQDPAKWNLSPMPAVYTVRPRYRGAIF